MKLEEIERLVIEKTLNEQAATSRRGHILGIYRPRLYSKIKK